MASDQPSWTTPADLWVLTADKRSLWLPLLNWYCNGQLVRGLKFKRLELSDELLATIEELEFPVEEVETMPPAPLLVFTENLLPAKNVLVWPTDGPVKKWLAALEEAATRLGAKSMQVFLPPEVTPESIGKIKSTLEIHLVGESRWPGE